MKSKEKNPKVSRRNSLRTRGTITRGRRKAFKFKNEKLRENNFKRGCRNIAAPTDAENQSLRELKSQKSEYNLFCEQLFRSLDELHRMKVPRYHKKNCQRTKVLEKKFKLESKRFQQALPIYIEKSTILEKV